MSLQPKEMKAKRISTMKTGIHLAIIADILILRNAAKEIILNEGHKTFIVLFKTDKGQIHEAHYLMDKDWRQKDFDKMLTAAQATPKEGATLKKEDAVNKRLWLAIKEVHYIEDDKPVLEDGEPKIEYFIFKVSPCINGGKRPLLDGDPDANNGVPSGHFIDYKNVSISASAVDQKGEIVKQEPAKAKTPTKAPEVKKAEEKVEEADEEEPSFVTPAQTTPKQEISNKEILEKNRKSEDDYHAKKAVEAQVKATGAPEEDINWDESPVF